MDLLATPFLLASMELLSPVPTGTVRVSAVTVSKLLAQVARRSRLWYVFADGMVGVARADLILDR